MPPLPKADAQELMRQSARMALQSLPVECVTGKTRPRRPQSNAERLRDYHIRRGLHGLLQKFEEQQCAA
jgi:hypothetical protein